MATWKLTRMQFMTLQKLFEQIEMTSSDFSARGLHYDLIALLNDFGFYPVNSYAAIELAEELLSIGYD